MDSTCPSCDTENRLTAQGLCASCQDDLRVVVRPAAHRQADRRLIDEPDLGGDYKHPGVVVIVVRPDHDDLWICDFCTTRSLSRQTRPSFPSSVATPYAGHVWRRFPTGPTPGLNLSPGPAPANPASFPSSKLPSTRHAVSNRPQDTCG